MTNLTLKKLNVLLLMIFSMLIFKTAEAQVSEEWINRFNLAGFDSRVNDMEIDQDGNIYVAGYVSGKETGKDFMVLKYSAKGEELWSSVTAGEGGLENNEDEAREIMIDIKGNVYATGKGFNSTGASSFRTVKFDTDGNIVWDRYFNVERAIEFGYDEAVAGAVDRSGNIIVAGTSLVNDSYDYTIVKYSSDGNVLWYRTYDRLGGSDILKDVAVDDNDNIIVTGSSSGLFSGTDYLTIMLDANGEEKWSDVYNNIGGNLALSFDEPTALTLDERGDIYVTGYSSGIGTSKDFLTIKFDTKGNRQWISRQSKQLFIKGKLSDEIPSAISVDKSGNVYLTGTSYLLDGGSDLYTVKLDAEGHEEWTDLYDSGLFENTLDEANGISVDLNGNVFVTGHVNGTSFGIDCGNEKGKNVILIKYSVFGGKSWIKEFNGPGMIGRNDDVGRKLLTDNKGKVYVSGESHSEDEKTDIILISYKISGIKQIRNSGLDNSLVSLNNYPNPFNPETVISFNLPREEKVSVRIYDVNGKMIEELINTDLPAGKHNYKWNASALSSGVYFYRMVTAGADVTKRMFLIK